MECQNVKVMFSVLSMSQISRVILHNWKGSFSEMNIEVGGTGFFSDLFLFPAAKEASRLPPKENTDRALVRN